MASYDEMIVLSKDEYYSLTNNSNPTFKDSISGDLQGSQVNNIEKVVVIQSDKLSENTNDYPLSPHSSPSSQSKNKNNKKINQSKNNKRHVIQQEDHEVSFPFLDPSISKQSTNSSKAERILPHTSNHPNRSFVNNPSRISYERMSESETTINNIGINIPSICAIFLKVW